MNRIGSLTWAAIFLVLVVGQVSAKSNSQLTNATVLIIRHAEKPAAGKDLAPAGFKRAQAYVPFFNSLKIDSQPVKLDHLFAAQESKNSDRCRETLTPVSNALRLKLHTRFGVNESQRLVDKVRRSYSDEAVLICWHHGSIPNLLRAFGVNPTELLPGGKWPEEVFGWMIVLRYDQDGKVSASIFNEAIAPDDANHPPPSHK
jgi:hypothetical protein